MIRFGKDGITTDEATIAAMFLDERIEMYWHGAWCLIPLYDDWDISVNGFAWSTGEEGYEKLSDMIRIPYALVWQAIQPVEGEAFVFDKDWNVEPESLEVDTDYNPKFESPCYHKRVLLIIDTRGELRELIAKCKEERG